MKKWMKIIVCCLSVALIATLSYVLAAKAGVTPEQMKIGDLTHIPVIEENLPKLSKGDLKLKEELQDKLDNVDEFVFDINRSFYFGTTAPERNHYKGNGINTNPLSFSNVQYSSYSGMPMDNPDYMDVNLNEDTDKLEPLATVMPDMDNILSIKKHKDGNFVVTENKTVNGVDFRFTYEIKVSDRGITDIIGSAEKYVKNPKSNYESEGGSLDTNEGWDSHLVVTSYYED